MSAPNRTSAPVPEGPTGDYCGHWDHGEKPTKAYWSLTWPSGRWNKMTVCGDHLMEALHMSHDDDEDVLVGQARRG